jgi:hypothetical protein
MHDHPSPPRAVWIAQLAAAAILGQTLVFKFGAAPESVWIFRTLGAEPWGRLGSGAVEALAVALLLTPRGAVWGALLGLGTMLGAIASHLAILGVEVQGDGGLLFALANVVLACCATVLWLRRAQWLALVVRRV